MDSTAIASALASSGFCVDPEFFDAEAVKRIRADLDRVQVAGNFHSAGIGPAGRLHQDSKIRKDEIFWLERGAGNAVQNLLWQRLDALQSDLNQMLFLGLKEFEGHYAAYPEGGFYKRHRDCFQNNNDRMVSLVLYLNCDWTDADGGRLRIYHGSSHVDVEPAGGTLVLFMSRDLDHEVLLSHRARYSFTGWFKVRGI